MPEVFIETVGGVALMELTTILEADGALWSIFVKANDLDPILAGNFDPDNVALLLAKRCDGALFPALISDLERLSDKVDMALASLVRAATA